MILRRSYWFLVTARLHDFLADVVHLGVVDGFGYAVEVVRGPDVYLIARTSLDLAVRPLVLEEVAVQMLLLHLDRVVVVVR